ncbi:ATP-binding cassette domain-containing protein [Candidatus Saccharibacteria bacterium]|nr:ATP-binding cassette domain-containing protein [Candidatus Saccharibacteria bacterium]
MQIIEAKNLQIGYNKDIIHSHLDFTVSDHDFICVVGSNGSGKTTLILTILGLIPKISGELKVKLEKTEIGYMPQTSKLAEDFPATVYEIVESGTLTNHRGKADIEEVIRQFNLTKYQNTKFSQLSGGQKQRTLLARAVVATSRLLILDEPYNNLDSTSREKLYLDLRKLNEKGIAIIMITHDLDHSSLVGDKTLALLGDDYFFGPTSQYIKKVHRENHHV